MTTRQRAYQIRNVAIGRCAKCPRRGKKGLCRRHRLAHNAARTTEAFKANRRERRRVLALMRQPWRFFGLVPPYSADDVRRAFRRMIGSGKVKHTDHGGDGNLFRFFEAMVRKAIAAIVPMQVSKVPALPAKRKRRFARKSMAPRWENG